MAEEKILKRIKFFGIVFLLSLVGIGTSIINQFCLLLQIVFMVISVVAGYKLIHYFAKYEFKE